MRQRQPSLLDSLPFNNQELLEQRAVEYLDLSFLKQNQKTQKELGKTFYQIAQLIDKLNPTSIPPHFNVITGSERPFLLPELKGDNLPIFIAGDRQGILWVRPVYVVNGLKQAQTARDGNADNITPTDITAIDVASFLYGFDGTDWDRLRTIVDNADNLVAGNPGHLGVMAKLLGFDGSTYDRLQSGGNASDAQATTAAGVLKTLAHLMGWNGTTWDRNRSGANDGSGLSTVTTGVQFSNAFIHGVNTAGTSWARLLHAPSNSDALGVDSGGMLKTVTEIFAFNGTSWDRLRSGANNADALAVSTLGNINSNGFLRVFNGTTWDRLRSGGTDLETQAYETLGNAHVVGYNFLDNGASWDRARSMSEANQAAASGTSGNRGSSLVAMHGNWSILNFPATNTAATATRAADAAGRRHVLTSLHFSVTGAAAAPAAIIQCVIRDGAAGAGTIIWSGVLAAPAATAAEISLGNLSIVGSANTALTIEFTGASGAGTQQSVSASGYTTTIS